MYTTYAKILKIYFLRIKVFCVLFLINCSFGYLYSQDNIANSDFDLTKQVVYFKTKDTSLLTTEVIDSFKCDYFKPLPYSRLSFWCEDEIFWFIVKIPKTYSPGSYFLQIAIRHVHSIKVYFLDSKLKLIKEFDEVGDQYVFKQRVVQAPEFAFPVQLIDTSSYFLFKFHNPWRKIVSTKILLFPESKFVEEISKKQVFFAFVAGIWSFAFLIVCTIILFSGTFKYLVFLLHFITLIVYQLAFSGMGFQYVWSDFPLFNIYTYYFILVSSSVYMYFLYQYFLADTLKSNFVKWCFLGNVVLSSLFMLLVFYHASYRTDIYVLLSKLMYSTVLFYTLFFGFVLFWYLLSRKNILAFLLVMANFFSIIAGILIGLAGMNMIYKSYVFDQLLLILFSTDLLVLLVYIAIQTKNKYNEFLTHKLKLSEMVIEQQQAKLERQNLLSEERARIASEMHDDLSSGLTTIRYLTNKALEKGSREELGHIRRIADQSKSLIASLAEIIWAMNSSQDDLENLLSYTRRHISEMCEEFSIKLNWKSDVDSLEGIMISGERRRHFFLVVKEVFHNIIKHAHATEVLVDFRFQEGILYFDISDNGRGFDKNQLIDSGNGLQNMERRMKKLQGKFSIVKIEKGTKVTLEFVP